MLTVENFFVLAALLVFIFKVIVPLLPSETKTNFQNKFPELM